MVLKTRGIILRTVKYSETSIIADIFTEAKGLRTYIISGVRTSKSKVSAGLIQVMSLVDMVCYEKEDSHKLNRIKEIKAAYVYTTLPFDVLKLSVGIFMAEVAQRTIKETEENKDLFNFLFNIFTFLDSSNNLYANLHISYLLELSAHLGFQPHDLDNTYNNNFKRDDIVFDLKEGYFTQNAVGHTYFMSPKLSKILFDFLKIHWQDSHKVKISNEDRRQLLKELITFYKLHIENLQDINSHKILNEIL